MTFGYQWRRCDQSLRCADIADATGTSLLLTGAENGNWIAVLVTATNPAGSTQAYSETSDEPVGAPGGGVVDVANTEASLRHAAVPHGRAASAAQLLKHNGYRTRFHYVVGGTFAVRWTAVPAPGAAPVKVAAAQTSELLHNTRDKTKIKLSAAGRRLLKHNPHPTLTITSAFVPKAGPNLDFVYPVFVTTVHQL